MTQSDSISTTDTSGREKTQEQVIAVVKRIAAIAGTTQNFLTYILGVGALATFYLMWLAYSADSTIWWNIVKGLLLIWPVSILGFTWTVLGQLHEVPEAVGKLNQDTQTAYAGIKEVKIREPKGLRGMFSVLNAFRREGSLGTVFDTVSGITLLLNPLFLFVGFLSLVIVLLLSFSAFLILLF